MTATIKKSVSELNTVVDRLEASLASIQDNQKTAPKSVGSDLFSYPNQNNIDAKAIASRLDGAIAKVEKLLREG